MRFIFETFCLALFFVIMVVPALYGLHMYVLMLLSARPWRRVANEQAETIRGYSAGRGDESWPVVTTQLPLYNELTVAARVMEAVAAMDYPVARHEIQVLDDSSDETRAIVDQTCQKLRKKGHNVVVIRRGNRDNYKAGALAHGLKTAAGQYVAIFDADFLPQAGFLRRLIPLIDSDAGVCCVQGRWGHINSSESWITESLAIGIDGHFGVEQPARAWNGFLLNFNGTAGIWRRQAITDPRVGGWQGDTLTEDLDLSYRAQLAGWRIVYCASEVVPAEIPSDSASLKAQQRRWALGSVQTARKLLPKVWASRLPLLVKCEASLHLTQYVVNVFMVLTVLLGRFLLVGVPRERYEPWLQGSWALIFLAAVAPSISYLYARKALGEPVPGPIRIVKLVALGLGLSVNNCVAVLAGLWQKGGEFVRTPKSGTVGELPASSPYSPKRPSLWLLDILVGLFALAEWVIFLKVDRYVGGTFLLLFAAGLLILGWQARPRRGRAPVRLAAPGPLPISAQAEVTAPGRSPVLSS